MPGAVSGKYADELVILNGLANPVGGVKFRRRRGPTRKAGGSLRNAGMHNVWNS